MRRDQGQARFSDELVATCINLGRNRRSCSASNRNMTELGIARTVWMAGADPECHAANIIRREQKPERTDCPTISTITREKSHNLMTGS
jgi:hypothetical protein